MTGSTKAVETATIGGGCFWCLEAVFEQVGGVVGVGPGYSGGHVVRPTYEQVCSGATGHAEVVQVHFDAAVIGYREVLEVFFAVHDPTTKDRQGHDVGPQYRSVVFCHDAAQEETAQSLIAELAQEGVFPDPIVTEVAGFERFWPAEEYHHRYFQRNPTQPYCTVVVGPKVARFRERFPSRLRAPVSAPARP